MFCWCPLHGKEISYIRFRCGEKFFFKRLIKARDWIVKQVGVKIFGWDIASSPSGSITSFQQNYYGVGNTTK